MTTAATPPSAQAERTLLGHPRGLATLFNIELWERFSYYGMRAILLYYIVDTAASGGLGLDQPLGEAVVATYGAAVYLLSVVGGWLADRVIGAQRSVFLGGVVIMAGHVSLAIPTATTSWLGIGLVALGTGLLKPNVSTMVGHLYGERDPRKDSGFTIFYMSINIGAFFAPFVVAFLRDQWGYHAGFSAAAVGMLFALVAYVVGRGALAPVSNDVPNPLQPRDRTRTPLLGLGLLVLIAVLLVAARLLRGGWVGAVIDTISILSVVASISYFVVMFRSTAVTARERTHLTAYLPMWIGAVLFWMIFEQAASKMAAYAANRTDLDSLGFHFSEEWFQSINPISIMLLAPLFGLLWVRRAGRFPSTPMKFATGVILAGVSFVVLSAAAAAFPGATSPVWVLVGVFVIQTLGELCLSPVGLSATTSLAPKAFASQAMALWFLAIATGQSLAAQFIRAMEGLPDGTFFLTLGIMAVVVGLALAALSPWVHARMKDAEPEHA
ncbi:diguanylate cyclase [Janibacter sp. Soil728]|uniref:peptide MFS transporter n=1 Tax=Janibacter sp. Soil728 TaxID=1736393 RepID=UPI0006FE283A|nr:oligopeptide:H+ symporter [Janibacter sp. Soil728]KRE38948.1 diguanylate cyclase [Janibacter sp. Soil728]